MALTEKELLAAVGARVWQQAKKFVKAGRVRNATEKNGVFTGELGGGEGRPRRPKVVVRSATDIGTFCGCAENRATGALCMHGCAVVLAALQGVGNEAPKKETARPRAEAVEMFPVKVLLPGPFVRLLEEREVLPVRWAAVAEGGVNGALMGLDTAQKSGVMQLRKPELAVLLKMAAEAGGGLEVDGLARELRIGDVGQRWPLQMQVDDAEVVHLAARPLESSEVVLELGGAVWIYDKNSGSLQSVSSGGKEGAETLLTLLDAGRMEVGLEEFLGWGEWWNAHFAIEPTLRELGVVIEERVARHELAISGGSRGLVASLKAEAVGGIARDGAGWVRVIEPRVDAAEALRRVGWLCVDAAAQKYELRGEDEVRVFLAHRLGDLERSGAWAIEVAENIEAYRGMLEPLTVEYDFKTSGGEDWTGFEVGFRAPGSDRLSLNQVRQLLARGRGTVKMRSGKTAVIAPGELEEIDSVLYDADVEQVGGAMRVDARQAMFLREVAGEGGIAGNTEDVVNGVPELAEIMRSYQLEGVAFLSEMLKRTGGVLLADDMGLGKTLQSLAVMAMRRVAGEKGAFLVVCPTSLLGSWRAEMAKFLPGWRVNVYHGARRELTEDADVVVTTYALAARDEKVLAAAQWGVIVLDEASVIRNAKTQSARAVMRLQGAGKMALTGTPVENSVNDLWSVFRFLLPGYLGTQKDFAERYEKPLKSGEGDVSVLRRLRQRIAPFMLRRTKGEVAKDLPEKIMVVEPTPMGESQGDVYHSLLRDGQQVVEEFAAASGGDAQAARMQVLTLLLRLRQAACDPRLLGVKGRENDVGAKVERLRELLREAIAGGHKVLVFSQFVSMLELISEMLEEEKIAHCKLTGGTRDRSKVVDEFQTKDGPPVFLISLKAGGYGLTLTEADTVVHFDPWWNPAVENQATDRAHRIGQTRPVTVYKLVAEGTVEEKIVALQAKKQQVLDAAFDEKTPLMGGLSDGELSELLEG